MSSEVKFIKALKSSRRVKANEEKTKLTESKLRAHLSSGLKIHFICYKQLFFPFHSSCFEHYHIMMIPPLLPGWVERIHSLSSRKSIFERLVADSFVSIGNFHFPTLCRYFLWSNYAVLRSFSAICRKKWFRWQPFLLVKRNWKRFQVFFLFEQVYIIQLIIIVAV